MTPAGVEAATFRFVAQHLNHCATAEFLSYLSHFFLEWEMLQRSSRENQNIYFVLYNFISKILPSMR